MLRMSLSERVVYGEYVGFIRFVIIWVCQRCSF
jgi:hypothetical protein